MKKILTILVLAISLTSCVNQNDRLKEAQRLYPKAIVTPPTSLLGNFDALIEDTIGHQIYVLSFYPFSTTRVQQIRNIK